MKRKTIAAGVLALTLILSANIGTAWAYFSTYATAKGGLDVTIDSPPATPKEDFEAWTKKVTVKTSEDAKVPVYVRVKAFNGSTYTVTAEDKSDGKWTEGDDGYYYYSDILNPGGESQEIDFKISDVPEDATEGDFDVVVVTESTPILYDENGDPFEWNSQEIKDQWNSTVDVIDSTGGDE